MCKKQRYLGFSLMELLVSMSIMSVSIIIFFNNSNQTMESIKTTTNTIMNAISLAKNYAISNNSQTIFCISYDKKNCVETKDWHNNWLIFVDKNSNKVRDSDELILLDSIDISKNITVSFGSKKLNLIVFHNNGRTNTNNTFYICLKSQQTTGQGITISHAGRYRVSQDKHQC